MGIKRRTCADIHNWRAFFVQRRLTRNHSDSERRMRHGRKAYSNTGRSDFHEILFGNAHVCRPELAPGIQMKTVERIEVSLNVNLRMRGHVDCTSVRRCGSATTRVKSAGGWVCQSFKIG